MRCFYPNFTTVEWVSTAYGRYEKYTVLYYEAKSRPAIYKNDLPTD